MNAKTLLGLAAIFAVGCAAPIAPVPLQDGTATLADDQTGLLVLVVDSETRLDEIAFSGERSFIVSADHLRDGSVVVVPLPAGRYRMDHIRLRLQLMPLAFSRSPVSLKYDLAKLKTQPVDFSITAGRVNYLGHLRIDRFSYSLHQGLAEADIEMVNRSSFIYTHLRQHAGELIARYPLVHVGYGNDGFFTEIKKLEELSEEAGR